MVMAGSAIRRGSCDQGRNADDSIANYCCFLHSVNSGAQGCGFIVEFEGLQTHDQSKSESAKLLALDWKKQRKETGKLQTDYALVTSHNTIPCLSPSELKGWTISCQGIRNSGEKQPLRLSDLVCGGISCCGPESIFGIAHGDARMFLVHRNLSCQVELNITILFLNKTFEKRLRRMQESLHPPAVSVEKCLDRDIFSHEFEQIISALSSCHGREQAEHRHSVHVYCFSCPRLNSLKATEVSVGEQQDTLAGHRGVICHDISIFRSFQKVYYKESNNSGSSTLVGRCYGSPVVYYNPDTKKSSVIGVHVGETDKKGQYVAATLHGILQILQGLSP